MRYNDSKEGVDYVRSPEMIKVGDKVKSLYNPTGEDGDCGGCYAFGDDDDLPCGYCTGHIATVIAIDDDGEYERPVVVKFDDVDEGLVGAPEYTVCDGSFCESELEKQ